MLIVVPSRRAAAQLADRTLRDGATPSGGLGSRAAWTAELVTLREVVERALGSHPAPRRRLSPAARAYLAESVVAALEPEVRPLFGPGIDGPGAARAVGSAIDELRMAGLSAVELAAAAGDARRLRALAAALDAWERRLAGLEAWDDADALREAASLIRAGEWPRADPDRLEVRGLYDVTTLQGELLVALARRAKRTRVHVPFDPDEPDATAFAYPYVHLWEGLVDPGLDVELRFPDGAASARVAFRAAADPADEARRAADTVRGWIDAGASPEEVAVVVPDVGRRAPALGRELDRRGVPFHARRGPALAETPLFAAALLPFRLLEEGWPRDAIRAWAASPLTGGLDPIELLPAVERGPASGGGLAEWNRALSAARGASAARLVAALREIDGAARTEAPPVEFWRTWSAILDLAGVGPETAGDPAWSAWEEVLAETREGLEALGLWDGPPAGWRRHRRHVLEAIGDRRAGIGRPGRGVEIVTPLDARGLGFARQIVLGLGQGALARPDTGAVLGDRERRALDDRLGRRAFRASTEGALEGSLLLAERLRETRDEIVLSWAAEDAEGNPVLPAFELERERRRRGVPLVQPPEPSPAPAWRVEASAERVSALQELERDRAAFFARERGTRSAFAGRHDGAFGPARAAALQAEFDDGALALWSASALESWRRCPHQFFQRYVLRLRPPEERPLEAEVTTVGKLAHAALQVLFRDATGAREADGERVRRALARAEEELAAAGDLAHRERGDPRVWSATVTRVAATLVRYLSHLASLEPAEIPAALELEFGGDDGLPPVRLATPRGEVLLRGRLDRLDRDPAGRRLVVVDYKYSRVGAAHREAVDPAACGVDRFQLLAYFLGALAWVESRGDDPPASLSGTIHCLREPRILGPLPAPPQDEIRGALARAIDAAGAGRYDPSPRDTDACKHCDYRRTCRIASVAGAMPPPDQPEDEE